MQVKCTTCKLFVVLPPEGEAVIPDCDEKCKFESSFELSHATVVRGHKVSTKVLHWRGL